MFSGLFNRLRALFHPETADAELDEELRFHFDKQVEKLVQSGLPMGEARRRARLLIGGSDAIEEECRDARRIGLISTFLQDVRYGFRMLRKFPASAVGAILLLALGMGGVAVLFGPLYSLVLSPLPFPNSDRLVRIGGRLPIFSVYNRDFVNRRSLDLVFSAVAAFATSETIISSGGPPENLTVASATKEFFDTLGVAPRHIGGNRAFADITPGESTAVVSDRIWRTRLKQAQDLSKCTITLASRKIPVAGVMPPNFSFPPGTDIWLPGGWGLATTKVTLIGRMPAGMALNQAAARLKAIAPAKPAMGMHASDGPLLQSLQTFMMGDRQPLLWMLWAVSILFLLLACAGAANLVLARGVRRRAEMAVRMVLGAGRKRLLRQLLTEVLILAAAGSLLGLAISRAGLRWLQSEWPAAQGTASNLSFFIAVIGLLSALAVMATILCGLAPAFHVTRGGDLFTSLKSSNSSGTVFTEARRRGIASHELLAGVQLILAMALLISTALLLRSMSARLNIPLGFQPQNVAVIKTGALPPLPELVQANLTYYAKNNLDATRGYVGEDVVKRERVVKPWRDAERRRNKLFYSEALHRLATLPGAVSVAMMGPTPFGSDGFLVTFLGFDPGVASDGPVVNGLISSASPEAFSLLDIRILAGRTFTSEDILKETKKEETIAVNSNGFVTSAIVNNTFARRLWPNQEPIGKEFTCFGKRRVVGVVSDIRQSGESIDIQPAAYFPFPMSSGSSFIVKLKPGVPLKDFAAAAERSFAGLMVGMPAPTVEDLQDLTTKHLANLRLSLALLSCFSLLGVVVAGLSVYAIASLEAAARLRETGIRIAMGASAGQIRRYGLWRSFRIAAAALPIGALLAWGLAHGLAHWLFQVGIADPASYASSAVILLIVAVGAGLPPVFKAASTDPSTVLRCE